MLSLQQREGASRDEVEVLLNEARIWDFETFGWLNADDIDPNFVGHARRKMNRRVVAKDDPEQYRRRGVGRPARCIDAEWLIAEYHARLSFPPCYNSHHLGPKPYFRLTM
jgi:hypothetical protein